MSYNKPQIIWTLPQADLNHSSKVVTDSKQVYLLPLTAQDPLEVAPIPLGNTSRKPLAFAFTSVKAIEFCLNHQWLINELQQASLFCFGDKTYDRLKSHRWKVTQIPASSALAMFEQLDERGLLTEYHWVFPGGGKRAYHPNQYFQIKQFSFQTIDLYQTRMVAYNPKDLQQLNPDSVLCFASPLAVKAYLHHPDAPRFNAATIGETTATACENHFSNILRSSQPTLDALFEAAAIYINHGNSCCQKKP